MDITQKVDAVTKIGDDRLGAGGVQPPPKSVKIELTARCNLRCKYCALATRKKQPKKDMDLDFFKAITADMRRAGVEEIGLFYLGESFMNPQLLIQAVRWCKQSLEFPWVFLTSNATRARPEWVEAAMEAGLDSLKWSTNFRSARHFHEITGASAGLWGNTVDNIQRAFRIRNDGKYKTLLSASSIIFYEESQLKKTRAFLERYIYPFVDTHYWLPTYQMGMESEKIREKLGYTPGIGNVGRLDEETMKPLRPAIPCWAVFTEGHVRVDGGLSACCFGADDRFDMGALNGINFMEQWNSLPFVALRKAHIDTMDKGVGVLLNTPCKVCAQGAVQSGDILSAEQTEKWRQEGGHP